MQTKTYNLVKERWIPIVGHEPVSLRDAFDNATLKAVGGTPVEKIALFKLLLAIGQSAFTPSDEKEWRKAGVAGFKKKVLKYLDDHADKFDLYGNTPFLQMPTVAKAKVLPFSAAQFMVSAGNTTVVTQIQVEKALTEAEKAVLLITQMGFALGGKKVDSSVVLTKGYDLKKSSGMCGTSLLYNGALHTFIFNNSLIDSIYNNIFTNDRISSLRMFSGGVGRAPWEVMPKGENDSIAKHLKQSYIGRLVPMCRFILLNDNGMHYVEGIQHPSVADSIIDPSFAVDFSGVKPKVLYCNPNERPWRQLSALLSYTQTSKGYNCFQIQNTLPRMGDKESFLIWSGGVKVSFQTGEQTFKGEDDFVESEVYLSSSIFDENSNFFNNIIIEMEQLEFLKSKLFATVSGYYTDMKVRRKPEAASLASKATNTFWQICGGEFQNMISICMDYSEEKSKAFRSKMFGVITQLYNDACPKVTAKQMAIWAKNKPVRYATKINKSEVNG